MADEFDRAYDAAVTDDTMVEDGQIKFVRKQRVDPIFDYAAHIRDNQAVQRKAGANYRHVASIPLVLAEVWAAECGAAVGTHEFGEYAKKKILSGDYAKIATGKY